MKIGYLPSISALLKKSSIRQGQTTSRYTIKAVKAHKPQSRPLMLDAQTKKDLEIFASEGDSQSLFELYNSTRTQGGGQILRQRMDFPFADAQSILAAQQAIEFIARHENIFAKIGFWITGRVERYLRDPLMFIVPRGLWSFAIGALTMKLVDNRHYIRIFRGVQLTCLLVQSLRKFLQQVADLEISGELAPLIEEISLILNNPEFTVVPKKELHGKNFFRVLRLDQSFRIYNKESVQRLLHVTYELDALLALADATYANKYVIPNIIDGQTQLAALGLTHPLLPNAIPNDISLDQESRLLFLTGPNMAGKTTYLKAIATATYLAHLGMGVPAREFSFTPVESLFSSISITDNLHSGTSYFLAEVLRIKAIAEAVAGHQKVIAVMDEPFKGTNVKDALEASSAIIRRLVSKPDCLFLFSSHLIELEDEFETGMKIKKAYFEADESAATLHFDYQVHAGVSSQRLGMRVLSEQGVLRLLDRQLMS